MTPEEGVALSFASPVAGGENAAANNSAREFHFDPLSIAAPELSARYGITLQQWWISHRHHRATHF
jgi:hypothetical protein